MKKTMLSVICLVAVGSAGSGQSLMDEIFVNGEILAAETLPSADTTDSAETARQARQQELRSAAALRARARNYMPSLWDIADAEGNLLDPDLYGPQTLLTDTVQGPVETTLSTFDYLPLIFSTYSVELPGQAYDPFAEGAKPLSEMDWAERSTARNGRNRAFRQQFMLDNPELVPYNISSLPEPPKIFVMEVDPSQAKITVQEITHDVAEMAAVASGPNLGRINWLRNFNASVQFSQAYVSPNWYQGGNSNLNAIANVLYDVKLNPAYHPNLIFETSFQYKLGANNAPEDTIHSYNISEDLLQINSKFGYRAAKRWYYSVSAQFKTQLLNNYKVNSDQLTAAFLSPGELNVGVGMTYDYENDPKTVKFTAALSPLSYNLKTCINNALDPTTFGIDEGRHTVSQYGSSAEITFKWKIAYNIEYFSRVFCFSNYEYITADWENTINFNINKFLTTRLYAHLRYQSDAPTIADTRWHRWQLKEILSIGFSYTFSRS